MSFRQIFNRINSIARAGLYTGRSSREDELRAARELIEEHRRRSEPEWEEPAPRSRKEGDSSSSRTERSESGGMTYERAVAIVGVGRTATFAEVTRAYRERIVKIHPDRLAGAGRDTLEEAKRMTQELNEAYSFLKREMAAK